MCGAAYPINEHLVTFLMNRNGPSAGQIFAERAVKEALSQRMVQLNCIGLAHWVCFNVI